MKTFIELSNNAKFILYSNKTNNLEKDCSVFQKIWTSTGPIAKSNNQILFIAADTFVIPC